MDQRKNWLYLAYGSNLNRKQMELRCPTAKIVGTSALNHWRLIFRGGEQMAVATVERERGCKVPVLVWKLTPADERALDRYEGYPHLYRKEHLRVFVEGRRVTAMIYLMNPSIRPYGTPSKAYFDTIREGYESAGFDTEVLNRAVAYSESHLPGKTATNHKTAASNQEPPKRTGGALMEPKIKEQILAVRDTGEVNMFDTRGVQYIANREGFYELVIYLEDHAKEYINFLFGRNQ